jgi:hypothetical protein
MLDAISEITVIGIQILANSQKEMFNHCFFAKSQAIIQDADHIIVPFHHKQAQRAKAHHNKSTCGTHCILSCNHIITGIIIATKGILFIIVEAKPIHQTITIKSNGKLSENLDICSIIIAKKPTFANAHTCINNQVKNNKESHSTSFIICKK